MSQSIQSQFVWEKFSNMKTKFQSIKFRFCLKRKKLFYECEIISSID